MIFARFSHSNTATEDASRTPDDRNVKLSPLRSSAPSVRLGAKQAAKFELRMHAKKYVVTRKADKGRICAPLGQVSNAAR